MRGGRQGGESARPRAMEYMLYMCMYMLCMYVEAQRHAGALGLSPQVSLGRPQLQLHVLRRTAARALQVPSHRPMKDAPGASSSADAPSVVTAELSDADLRAEGKAEEERLLDGSDGQRVGSHCPRLADVLKIAVYIAAYLTIGPTLILVNRSLMKTHGFNYPMALSGLGLLFSTLVSFLLVHCCKLVSLPNRELVTAGFYVRNLLPVGAAMAGTLAAGNAVYLYLPVGFIQMLKAFTPSVTLALLWATRIEVPTWPVCGAVVGICLGTAIASAGEASLNLFGLGLMLLAELCEATRLVLVQKLLNNLKFGVKPAHAPATHRPSAVLPRPLPPRPPCRAASLRCAPHPRTPLAAPPAWRVCHRCPPGARAQKGPRAPPRGEAHRGPSERRAPHHPEGL